MDNETFEQLPINSSVLGDNFKFVKENKELVKENIKKKFQNEKLGLVDEVYEYDKTYREYKMKIDELRAKRNELSSSIGLLMRDGKKDEAEEVKKSVGKINDLISEFEEKEENLSKEIKDMKFHITLI